MESPSTFKIEESFQLDTCLNAQILPQTPPRKSKLDWCFIALNVALSYDNSAMTEYWIYDRDTFI